MKLDLLSEEDKKKFDAARQARESKAEARTKAFEEACRRVLGESNFDPTRFVAREFPPSVGGGWIMRIPEPGYFADVEKRMLKAGQGSDDAQRVVAEVVHNEKVRAHPPLDELHEIRRAIPGVYTTMFGEWHRVNTGEGNG